MLFKLALSAALVASCAAFQLGAVPGRRAPATRRHGAKSEVSFGALDGSACRVGIIKTRWNQGIIDSLAKGCKDSLTELGVKDENVFETEVPGAFELPMAARFLAQSGTVDAIVCIGCLIKGDTSHFEYISDATASGIMNVQLSTSVPCVFGVLTVHEEKQAKDRAKKGNNHGEAWGKTAVEMALLRASALGTSGGAKRTMGFGTEAAGGTQLAAGAPAPKGVGF